MKGIGIEPIGVRIENLSKVFFSPDKKKESIAVNHVSLDIEPGKLVTLLGPSGCGKTTILRMLSGFTLPTQGKILLGNVDMTNTPPNKRDIGMMFQSYALFPHLSVYENVAYGLRVKKLPDQQLREKVDSVLELMRITEFKDRIPEQLSGGQQQRVALARAIVTEPKILLFDEPLSNLDAKMREYMREELRKIQQKLQITSVYVTHDQVEAMAISDQVVIMNQGIIEQIGSPNDIYVHPANKFVADFMGKANFVSAVVKSTQGDSVSIESLGHALTVSASPTSSITAGSTASLMIRPEFLRVDPQGTYHGRVVRATYFGQNMEYEVDIAGNTLVMSDFQFLKNGFFRIGDEIHLAIDDQNLRVLAS